MKSRLLVLVCLAATGAPVAAEESASKSAPAALLKTLPKGAISLRWQLVSRQPPIWAHLSCVPRGHSKERQAMMSEKKSGPVTRASIDSMPSVEPSPFTLELFERLDPTLRSGGSSGWKRLSRATFTQSKDVQEIHTRFLDPRTRRHPVLVLHFGFTHWHEWEVFTMPRGWSGPMAHQTFYWGGEGETYAIQRFNRAEKGRLVIDEEDSDGENVTRGTFRWNGREWADVSQKWLVIGASSPSRKSIESLVARKGFGAVRRSNEFQRLRSGLWIWLVARYRSPKQARDHVRELRKSGVAAMVRRV